MLSFVKTATLASALFAAAANAAALTPTAPSESPKFGFVGLLAEAATRRGPGAGWGRCPTLREGQKC